MTGRPGPIRSCSSHDVALEFRRPVGGLMRFHVLLSIAVLLLSCVCLCRDHPGNVPPSCPITKPSDSSFVPPAPYGRRPAARGQFWYGTDRLWTKLPISGSWVGLPHYTSDDPTFRQKLFFWVQGFDAHAPQQSQLVLKGRRLDSAAPALLTDGPGSPSWTDDEQFLVTGINFPTTGCWEITATYADSELRFVVLVAGK